MKWAARGARYGQLRPLCAFQGDRHATDEIDAPLIELLENGRPIGKEQGPERGAASALSATTSESKIAPEDFASRAASEVIRRLFRMGLEASSALSISTQPAVSERLEALIREADTAIKELRLAIFELDTSRPLKKEALPGLG